MRVWEDSCKPPFSVRPSVRDARSKRLLQSRDVSVWEDSGKPPVYVGPTVRDERRKGQPSTQPGTRAQGKAELVAKGG